MTFYHRHLPHWHPQGAALFVTWRLEGSLPATAVSKELKAFDRTLDQAATGPKWLLNPKVADAIADTLRYGDAALNLYRLRAWVLMPNHVHILIHPNAPLAAITKSIKGFSARKANEILGQTGQPFWNHESYDHWIRTPDELEKTVLYIESNPVSAGLARSPEDWPWSSAHE